MSTEITLYADIPADEVSRMRALSNADLRAETAENQTRLAAIHDAAVTDAGELDWAAAATAFKTDAKSIEMEAHSLTDKVEAGKHMLEKRNEVRNIARTASAALPSAGSFSDSGAVADSRGAPRVRGMFSAMMARNENPELANEIRDMLQTNRGDSVALGAGVDDILNNVTTANFEVNRPFNTPYATLLNDAKVGVAQRLRRIAIPNGMDSYVFRRESGTGSVGITTTAEAGTPGTGTVDADKVTVTAVKRAVTVTMTKEVLADNLAFQDFVDMRLSREFIQDLEDQVLNGAGGNGNFLGLTTTTGKLAGGNLANANSDIFDHIRTNGVVKMQKDGHTDPSFMVMNISTLDTLMGQKIDDTDARYRWGSPLEGPNVNRPLWGVPVVVSQKMADNTILMVDSRDVAIAERTNGVEISVGTTGNDFRDGLRTMLFEYRANVIVFRPKSILDMKITTS